jgi:formylglycine-generating enzyme required for sulfatase activity
MRLLASALLLAAAGAAQPVDFASQIQPILQKNCLSCHGPTRALGHLRVDTREALLKGGAKGTSLVPGQPDKSPLYTTLEIPPGKPGLMPPGRPLPKEQRDLIRRWIAGGADWPAGLAAKAAAPKAPAQLTEEQAVAQLHKRIAANPTPPAMKPYTRQLEGLDVSFDMVPIPGGEFTMGTPDSEPGRNDDEGPQHKVQLDPFWMMKTEVTWDLYRLFMFVEQAKDTGKDAVIDAVSRPTRPYVEMSFGMGLDGYPAISMTQHAANKFAEWLSAHTGEFYRLPTEAEWEYACRAGTTTAYSFGGGEGQLHEYAWYVDNSNGKYQQVGAKKPNPWGLHDMHGNVMEWTLDQYTANYDPASRAVNPWVKATEPYPHAVRGGSWMDPPEMLRCGARIASDPSWKMQDPQLPKSIWYHTDAQGLGLRLVRPLKVPTAKEMRAYWNSGVEEE